MRPGELWAKVVQRRSPSHTSKLRHIPQSWLLGVSQLPIDTGPQAIIPGPGRPLFLQDRQIKGGFVLTVTFRLLVAFCVTLCGQASRRCCKQEKRWLFVMSRVCYERESPVSSTVTLLSMAAMSILCWEALCQGGALEYQ